MPNRVGLKISFIEGLYGHIHPYLIWPRHLWCVVFWIIIIGAFIISKRTSIPSYKVYRIAWLVMVIHVVAQSAYGLFLYQKYENKYNQIALSAGYVPFNLSVIGKNGAEVDIINTSLISKDKL